LEPDFSDGPADEYSDPTSSPAALAAANASLFFFFSSYLTNFYASLTIFSSCSLFLLSAASRSSFSLSYASSITVLGSGIYSMGNLNANSKCYTFILSEFATL
jgi:hypothetical protein